MAVSSNSFFSCLPARGAAAAFALAGVLLSGTVFAGTGKKLHQQYLDNDKIYDNPELLAYVTRIGDRLLAETSHARRKYTYVLVDEPSPNANAHADRYIIVHRGLFNIATSEAELASVIAHEIAHVIARHPARLKARVYGLNALSWLGSLATQTNAIGSATQQVGAVPLLRAKRGMELEADELGAQYLARAGYDPMAMISMLSQLKDWHSYQVSIHPQAQAYHGLFGSHPRGDKRLHDAVGPAMEYLPDELVEPAGDFYALIDGVPYGNESAGGVVLKQSFYHGDLRFVVTFPEAWDIANNPQDVTGTAPGGSQEGYASVSMLQPSKEKQDPETYIKETLQRDDIASGEAIDVNGKPGYIGEIKIASGDAKARMIAVVYKARSVFLFKGEAGAAGDAEQFKKQFRSIVDSFRDMEESDRAAAQSQRFRVITAEPGDTFASLAKKSTVKGRGEELLRAINGKWPRGEPRAGDYVKIIQ